MVWEEREIKKGRKGKKAQNHPVKVLIYIISKRKEGKLENFPIYHSYNTQLWISIATLISVCNTVILIILVVEWYRDKI